MTARTGGCHGWLVLAPRVAWCPHCVRQPVGPAQTAHPCADRALRPRPAVASWLPLSVQRCGLPVVAAPRPRRDCRAVFRSTAFEKRLRKTEGGTALAAAEGQSAALRWKLLARRRQQGSWRQAGSVQGCSVTAGPTGQQLKPKEPRSAWREDRPAAAARAGNQAPIPPRQTSHRNKPISPLYTCPSPPTPNR